MLSDKLSFIKWVDYVNELFITASNHSPWNKTKMARNCRDERWLALVVPVIANRASKKKSTFKFWPLKRFENYILDNFYNLSFKLYEYFGEFDYFREFKKSFCGKSRIRDEWAVLSLSINLIGHANLWRKLLN